MNSKPILSGADFSPSSDIKYSKPKVDTRGGKSVGILNSMSNTATYISTPLMITWGISDYEGNERYDMSLQFPNQEYSTQSTNNFMNNMIELENKIKSDASKNAKEWFGKAKMSEDAIDALWTPMLKYPKNKETLEPDTSRAPTLKVKIPYWEGEWKVELYNTDKETIFPDPTGVSELTPKDIISKGTHVAVVLQCGGLWFANGKFGVTWRLFQGIVKPKASLRGKCHIELSLDEKEVMDNQINSDESNETNVTSTEVVDSDDEAGGNDVEQDEQSVIEDSEEPVLKKTTKKKLLKKK